MKRVFCCVLFLCFVLLQSAVAQIFRVYIDPGHYGGNGASRMNKKTGEQVREEDVNLAVGLRLRDLLESGVSPSHRVTFVVQMSRDTDDSRRDAVASSLNLNEPTHRAKDANAFGPGGADLFLSIHCNSGGGDGTETFWCDRIGSDGGATHPPPGFKVKGSDINNRSERFADIVQKHIAKHGDWVSRHEGFGKLDRTYSTFENRFPKFGGHIPILLYLQVPGCLNEIGFLDNQDNLDKLVSPYWQHRFAEAYRDAIFEFFGLDLPKYLSLSLKSGAAHLISWPGIPIGNGGKGILINSRQFPATRILRRFNSAKKEYERVSQVVFGESYLLGVPKLAEREEMLDISFFPRTAYTIHLESGFAMIGSVSGNASFLDALSVANEKGKHLDPTLQILDGGSFVKSQDSVMKSGEGYLVRVLNPVTITVSAVAGGPTSVPLPADTQLFANFPNPFNPDTWIPFHLKNDGVVTLSIHTVSGHLVRTIPLGYLVSGSYVTKSTAAYWDGKNEHGTMTASGIYFYTLSTQNTSFTRKMLLLK